MQKILYRTSLLAGLACLGLAGCNAGEDAGTVAGTKTQPVTVSAQDSPATNSSPVINSAPVIKGSPSTSVSASSVYSFTPTASDIDGQGLGYSVANKPMWAAFSTATGTLTGTPTTAQIGKYPGIVISVSDGMVSQSLTAFSIDVTSATSAVGTATYSWTAPTQNTNGSALVNLAGYRVYHGTSASTLTDIRQVSSAGTTTFAFNNLASGTHYFAVAAYNAAGAESGLSSISSKTIL